MDRLKGLPNVAKTLFLIGCVLAVVGVVWLASPYSVTYASGNGTTNCGSVVAHKAHVAGANCNYGGHGARALIALIGGLVLAVGSPVLFKNE